MSADTMSAATNQVPFMLSDRYEQNSGVVLLSGIQALVRALQTRASLDQQAGFTNGGFVSGYRGSPLGGLDKELWSQEARLSAQNVVFQPGVNEDLAATAVWGSQQVGLHEGAKVDGVFGLWYGKAPGLDRSCDAIRHANAWGTSAKGGVLLVVGDDPGAKSSSQASQSEFALQDMMLPVLNPSDVQDVLDFAVLGWEMSRHSGLWVALKAVADHMDSAATVEVGLDRYTKFRASPAADLHIRIEDTPGAQEIRTLNQKLPAAIEYARFAGINKWVTQSDTNSTPRGKAKIGIITAGKAYRDVREACSQLGFLTVQEMAASGIELLKLGMTWPLDAQLIHEFAKRVDKIWVVEEKRAFVEPQIKEILYGHSTVAVEGKHTVEGAVCISSTGILEVTDLMQQLVMRLDLNQPELLARLAITKQHTKNLDAYARDERTPLFCAGCPHNTSTRVPEGSRATAGIGCHYMVQWMQRKTDSCTQMGGEGVTWVGEAPFTREKHLFANLGDGTYFHSGILAIRQAVAAKVNITYKILYNDAVAMTGGQPTDGDLSVADVIAQVKAEGVQHIMVVSDEPESLPDLGVEIRHRSELDAVQCQLREVSGVSIIVYEQTCATELRRRRKRGLIEDNRPRLLINEAVCDGCGDCTVQSNCVAVEPLETALGTKRKINQTSCNKDLSCASGFCPAFVEVSGELNRARGSGESDAGSNLQRFGEVDEPGKKEAANILIAGVGGTGIVTVSALLATAAKIDGKEVLSLDMTGLAQKGGAVYSHIRISSGENNGVEGAVFHTPRIPEACVDTLVACDLVSAASNESMALLSSDTLAVVNSHIAPTADFVLSQSSDTQSAKRMQRVKSVVGRMQSIPVEEVVAEQLGDTQQANIVLLGYAYQLGGIPLSYAALEEAIRINGTAVERNLIALKLGRWMAVHPQQPAKTTQSDSVLPLAQLMQHRRNHLIAYDGEKLASRFTAFVELVALREREIKPGSEVLACAVAESYAKLLAIKDEFEVARLYTSDTFAQQIAETFAPGAQLTYLLAPPLMGERKRKFGGWMKAAFGLLASMRGIRNTIFDPFAYSAERKQALFIIAHFEQTMAQIVPQLTLQNLAGAVAIAKIPLQIRGFGHVKARQMDAALALESQLLEEFLMPPTPVNIFDPGCKEAA